MYLILVHVNKPRNRSNSVSTGTGAWFCLHVQVRYKQQQQQQHQQQQNVSKYNRTTIRHPPWTWNTPSGLTQIKINLYTQQQVPHELFLDHAQCLLWAVWWHWACVKLREDAWSLFCCALKQWLREQGIQLYKMITWTGYTLREQGIQFWLLRPGTFC
jgi:hypothetical protein